MNNFDVAFKSTNWVSELLKSESMAKLKARRAMQFFCAKGQTLIYYGAYEHLHFYVFIFTT